MRSRSSHVTPAATSAAIDLCGLNSTVSFLRGSTDPQVSVLVSALGLAMREC
jgi:hypothetical protein